MTLARHSKTVDEMIETAAVRGDILQEIVDRSGLVDDLPVLGGRSLDLATKSDMVFCKAADGGLLRSLERTAARVVIAPEDVLNRVTADFLAERAFLVSDRPRLLMARLLGTLLVDGGVTAQTMHIHPDARIARDAVIAPGAVIGADVEIGARTVVGANAVIDHARIGRNSTIGSNSSIGSEGFSYETDVHTGEVYRFPHFGLAVLGDRVVIGANCGVARGSLQDTLIESDVKVDNLVHIAHNCEVGGGSYLTANVMLAGSVKVGAHCWLAPSTAIVNGVSLGDHAMTGMSAAVLDDVPENAVVVGVPARQIRERYRSGEQKPR